MAACTIQSSFSLSAQTHAHNGSLLRIPRVSSGKEFSTTNAYPRSRGSFTRLSISCMAQDDQNRKDTTDSLASSSPASVVPPSPADNFVPPSPKPVTTKKVSTSFGDVFAFSGPAPEKINGRLAMLGFVSALGVEIATGQDLVGQLSNGGLTWFIFVSALFTSASLIPLFKGVSAESKSKGFFSSQAETLNGRAAMVGLVALVLTEYVKGSPLL